MIAIRLVGRSAVSGKEWTRAFSKYTNYVDVEILVHPYECDLFTNRRLDERTKGDLQTPVHVARTCHVIPGESRHEQIDGYIRRGHIVRECDTMSSSGVSFCRMIVICAFVEKCGSKPIYWMSDDYNLFDGRTFE